MLDSTVFTPHRPLDAGDVRYVPRPDGAGAEIAKWVKLGRRAILLVGPVGVGKSTELAHASLLLQDTHTPVFIPIDRYANMRTITPEQLLVIILKQFAEKLSVSVPTVAAVPTVAQLLDVARTVLYRGAVGRKPLVLLLDGLEKLGRDQIAPAFDVLRELPEIAHTIATAPWAIIYGPNAEQRLHDEERVVFARPLDLDVAADKNTLLNIWLKRTQGQFSASEASFVHNFSAVVAQSGGLPRTFLQLLADAYSYAQLQGEDNEPTEADFAQAAADQTESWRRLLLPGDTDAIKSAVDTDGRELDLDRKIRLFAHGILLEWVTPGGPRVRVHPLILPLLPKKYGKPQSATAS